MNTEISTPLFFLSLIYANVKFFNVFQGGKNFKNRKNKTKKKLIVVL